MSYGPQTRNPIEHDESPLEEDRIPCGCGDARCWLDPNDSTNVNVNGRWFTSDCAGLCWNCGQVDDLRHMFPVGGGRLVHESCPDLQTEGAALSRLRGSFSAPLVAKQFPHPTQQPRGDAYAHAKLDPAAVIELRQAVASQRKLADKFGVSRALVRHVQSGRAWAWVNDGCPTPVMEADREAAAKADEARDDDFQQHRR